MKIFLNFFMICVPYHAFKTISTNYIILKENLSPCRRSLQYEQIIFDIINDGIFN
jgi:hypothetical protein